MEAARRKIEVTIAHSTDQIKVGNCDTSVYLQRGEAYMARSEHNRAMADFTTQLNADDPTNAALANYWCGRVHLVKEEHEDAMGYFKSAFGATVGSSVQAMAHVAASQAQLQLDQADQAVQHAKDAIALDESSAMAHAALGAAILNQKAPLYTVDAQHALDMAISLDEECDIAFSTRSKLKFALGELGAAFEDYKSAVFIDPTLIGRTAEKVMATVETDSDDIGSTQQASTGLVAQQTEMLTGY